MKSKDEKKQRLPILSQIGTTFFTGNGMYDLTFHNNPTILVESDLRVVRLLEGSPGWDSLQYYIRRRTGRNPEVGDLEN